MQFRRFFSARGCRKLRYLAGIGIFVSVDIFSGIYTLRLCLPYFRIAWLVSDANGLVSSLRIVHVGIRGAAVLQLVSPLSLRRAKWARKLSFT